MIIQTKIRGCVSHRSVDQLLAGKWALAIICGALVTACSGTIDTPTQEFPARQSSSNDTPAAAAPARQQAAAAPAAPAPSRSSATANPPASNAPPAAASADDVTPPAAAPADEPAQTASADLSFESDIWPIFQESCSPCHQSLGSGGQNIGSDDLDEALSDSKDFEDRVIAVIEDGSMPPGTCGAPPGGSGCVSEDDFAAIQAWYEAGTPE
jgi:hypothetical protein